MNLESNQNPLTDAPKTTSPPPPRVIRATIALFRFALPLLVIAIAILGAMYLLQSRPAATRIDAEPRAALVETILASPRTEIAEIIAYGTVEPHRELLLQPQVGGQVVRINENLRSGGRIPAGEMLFMIDPRDYEIAMIQREAEVANAAVALQLEEARGDVAQREWELLRDSIKVSEVTLDPTWVPRDVSETSKGGHATNDGSQLSFDDLNASDQTRRFARGECSHCEQFVIPRV